MDLPFRNGQFKQLLKEIHELWYGGVLLSNLVILNFKLFLSSNSMRH